MRITIPLGLALLYRYPLTLENTLAHFHYCWCSLYFYVYFYYWKLYFLSLWILMLEIKFDLNWIDLVLLTWKRIDLFLRKNPGFSIVKIVFFLFPLQKGYQTSKELKRNMNDGIIVFLMSLLSLHLKNFASLFFLIQDNFIF